MTDGGDADAERCRHCGDRESELSNKGLCRRCVEMGVDVETDEGGGGPEPAAEAEQSIPKDNQNLDVVGVVAGWGTPVGF